MTYETFWKMSYVAKPLGQKGDWRLSRVEGGDWGLTTQAQGDTGQTKVESFWILVWEVTVHL